MPSVLNMPGLGIWQGFEYTRVTKGTGYALIIPNMLEYASKYIRVLNASDAVHSIRSLYKLLFSY